MTLISKFN